MHFHDQSRFPATQWLAKQALAIAMALAMTVALALAVALAWLVLAVARAIVWRKFVA